MSLFDFAIGTPAFMTCVEMCIVSVVFLWSFSAEQYLELSRELPRTRSLGGALLDVLDIRDIFQGIWYMCKISFCCGGRSRGRGREFGSKEEDLESDEIELT